MPHPCGFCRGAGFDFAFRLLEVHSRMHSRSGCHSERLLRICSFRSIPFRILLLNNIDVQYRVNYTSCSFRRGGDGATLLVRATSAPSILPPRPSLLRERLPANSFVFCSYALLPPLHESSSPPMRRGPRVTSHESRVTSSFSCLHTFLFQTFNLQLSTFDLFSSSPFLFFILHTLFSHERTTTPAQSITSALFCLQRGGG